MTSEADRTLIFIHTSNSQLLPALVGIHSLRTRGGVTNPAQVKLLRLEGSELDQRRDGQTYRAGGIMVWNHAHHAAFHLIRRSVPELMGFQGRALVMDPDVFAVCPIAPLLKMDMAGKGVLARYIPEGYLGDGNPYYSTGVMLLECSRLGHWRWHEEVAGVFDHTHDYWHLLQLKDESPDNIGQLDERWNSLDRLTPETGLLHNTCRATQPWLTGLPIPDDIYDPSYKVSGFARLWRPLLQRPLRVHRVHPDRRQEKFFFELLAECLGQGFLPEAYIAAEIQAGRLRRDAFRMLERSAYRSGQGNNAGSGVELLSEFGITLSELGQEAA